MSRFVFRRLVGRRTAKKPRDEHVVFHHLPGKLRQSFDRGCVQPAESLVSAKSIFAPSACGSRAPNDDFATHDLTWLDAMTRVAWLTDLHLNFLDFAAVSAFLDGVARHGADALILSGDITESTELIPVLQEFEQRLQRPIYFVLGNHDYYFSSIAELRRRVDRLCRGSSWLRWLNTCGVVRLSQSVGLLGHDGWADGRLGDYERSLVRMNDWRLIEEFSSLDKQSRWGVLQRLADESADHVRRWLPRALDEFAEAVLVTHVPPFRGACWYEGRISDDQWLPHFSSKAMGEAILDVMRERPEQQLTVLCGHTHSPGVYRPLDNVEVRTGGAVYGSPEVQCVLEFD